MKYLKKILIFKRLFKYKRLSNEDIFRDIFDEDTLVISDKTSPSDIEAWDSLNHILLLSTVQDEFKIIITLEEMQSKINVESLVKIILTKSK